MCGLKLFSKIQSHLLKCLVDSKGESPIITYFILYYITAVGLNQMMVQFLHSLLL